MVFTSLSFVFLILPLFLAIDSLMRLTKASTLRNSGLLFVSLLFYTWGEAANVLLLVALAAMNYAAGNYLSRSKNSRLWIVVFVSANLAILIGFKYSIWLISFILPAWANKKASMPLGISFFTFHAISYLIDVYRRQIAPAKSALDFFTYFCMFPHLVAGPIVRYAQVKDDLAGRGPNKELFSFGMYRFLIGLNKKVIIANSVAIMSDNAFTLSQVGHLNFFDAWLGIMAYALQIYYDFSGYSDMAIGLAAMAGFRFEENFQRPYSSASIREFWRRWHISLSSWLRDYLYIPLGGSRVSGLVTLRNLLIVFFLCGLWHGANVTFIVWGLWHGMFLVLEGLPTGRLLQKMPTVLSRSYTLFVVLIGWVFFRAENFNAALAYLNSMFTFSLSPIVLTYYVVACLALVVGGILCLLPDKVFPNPTSRTAGAFSPSAYCLQIFLGILSIAFLLTGTRNPFIYFNF